jgi:hypothetical protein
MRTTDSLCILGAAHIENTTSNNSSSVSCIPLAVWRGPHKNTESRFVTVMFSSNGRFFWLYNSCFKQICHNNVTRKKTYHEYIVIKNIKLPLICGSCLTRKVKERKNHNENRQLEYMYLCSHYFCPHRTSWRAPWEYHSWKLQIVKIIHD